MPCRPDKLSTHSDYVLFHGTFYLYAFIIKYLVLFFVDAVYSLFNSARQMLEHN